MAASGVRRLGLMNWGPALRPSSVVGTLKMHDTEYFYIRSPDAIPGAAPANTFWFDAHWIDMDAGLPGTFHLLDATGPSLVVTPMLSGCSFVMTPGAGGAVTVAHIQPTNEMKAPALANHLARTPNAQVYGGIDSPGNYDPDDRTAAIIGVRRNGRWAIYAQKQQIVNHGDVQRIRSVYQIWPERVKQ